MFTRLTSLAGLILLLLAMAIVVLGAGFLLYGYIGSLQQCPPDAPVCRFPQFATMSLLFGVAALAVGALHGLVGIGTLRNGRRAKLVGLLVSVLGVAAAAFVGLTAFKPLGHHFDDAGNSIPDYSWQSIAFAACLIPYGLAALILLRDLRRNRSAVT